MFVDIKEEKPLTKGSNMNFGGSVRVNPMGIVVLGLILFLFLYINYPGGSSPTVTSSSTGSTVSMKALLAVSIEAAKRGGREVKRIRDQVIPGIIRI